MVAKSKHGTIFLGKDKETYGEEGTGTINYDPEYECYENICPFPPLETTTTSSTKLHIAIPSYRDPLCPRTLYYIYTKSAKPEKIHVRVVQQNQEGDVDCLEEYCNMISKNSTSNTCLYQDQIEIIKKKASEAHGPTWARALLSQHIRDGYEMGVVNAQDFCLSMDSHMDFKEHWDNSMRQMWNDAQNEYAVLSTYVEDRENIDYTEDNVDIPHLCMVTFTDNVRNHATKSVSNLSKPKLTNAIWGAGLSFSKCHAELKVPVDPHTPGIFDGEEFNRAARFFTYGYDIYTPNHVFILHDYITSQKNPKVHTWSNNNYKIDIEQSNHRLLSLLDIPGDYHYSEAKIQQLKRSKYGLGDRRTLDQLIGFSGVDLRHKKASIDGVNRCGNIKFVPFAEHPLGVDYLPLFDENEDPYDKVVVDETSVWFGMEWMKDDGAGGEGVHSEEIGKKYAVDHVDSSGSLTPKDNKATSTDADNDDDNDTMKRKADKNKSMTKQKIDSLVQKQHDSKLHLNKAQMEQQKHGIRYLPPLVKFTVILLILGVTIAIILSSKKKKKKKRRPKVRSL